MTVTRHPVMGFFAGLLFGLGLFLVLVSLGVVELSVLWLGIVVVAGVILGVVWAYAAPVRGRRSAA